DRGVPLELQEAPVLLQTGLRQHRQKQPALLDRMSNPALEIVAGAQIVLVEPRVQARRFERLQDPFGDGPAFACIADEDDAFLRVCGTISAIAGRRRLRRGPPPPPPGPPPP